MAYSPPLYNVVYFDDASTSYTPPLSSAVEFDTQSAQILILPAAGITFAGVAPSVVVQVAILVPAATITFAGVAPAITSAPPAAGSLQSHRTLAGGLALDGTRGVSHRMVLGGIAREGGGGNHRSVLGGMAKEGGAVGPSYNNVVLVSTANIALNGVAPVVALIPNYIVEVVTQSITETFGTVSLTWTAAQAGDLLVVCIAACTATTWNGHSGWTAFMYKQSGSGASLQGNGWYKVAVGGETGINITPFSGSGMKAAVFFNARGTDGTLHGRGVIGDHTAGAVTTATVLSGVPSSGAQGVSILLGGDDFLDNPGALSATIGGTNWTQRANVMSATPNDQAGIVVGTSSDTGTLPAATATFNRSVKGHVSDSFYLKA